MLKKLTICRSIRRAALALCAVSTLALSSTASAQGGYPSAPGDDGPVLTPRLDVDDVASAPIDRVRRAGLRIFSTRFNDADGYGDGPVDLTQPRTFGNRPSLQNPNTKYLRLLGLDTQSCAECHSIRSNLLNPAEFAIGGSGGNGNNVLAFFSALDVTDGDPAQPFVPVPNTGVVELVGRVINTPQNFGNGGVSLLGKEMTRRLQNLRASAIANPGQVVQLRAKGVDFGSITCDASGACNTDDVVGVNPLTLAVTPFGRKGDGTLKNLITGAMNFHFGIQAVEVFGPGDPDGDGVSDELSAGEVAAVEVWLDALEPPVRTGGAPQGRQAFADFGCADCHRPVLNTRSRFVPVSTPEIVTDPDANVIRTVDLVPAGFEENQNGGVRVPLFSDLKIHDMGPSSAESIDPLVASLFITAPLWGVADSAPYLHDGRALTLFAAIAAHDGEAAAAAAAFAAASPSQQRALLDFLGTLRAPSHPNAGL